MSVHPLSGPKSPSHITRRAALFGLALISLAGAANLGAQVSWPTRTVRFIVPSPAGTAPDVTARIVGEKLSRIWGQPVVIDNRPGAGGIVGFSAMKNSPLRC